MTKLTINGKKTCSPYSELDTPLTLDSLIHASGFRPGQVLVKINDMLIPMKNYSNTILQESDNVEVVSLLAGG